jgi:hypothetical protein
LKCRYSPQNRVEKAITEYLKNNLNDITSYQSIAFGELKNDTNGFTMTHIYRRKNLLGQIILDSLVFTMDSNFNIKSKIINDLINDNLGASTC